MKVTKYILQLLYIALICLSNSPATAQEEDNDASEVKGDTGGIYISVGQAAIKKSLMAFTPMAHFGSEPQNKKNIDVGIDLYKIILNDLTASNYFSFIDQAAYPENYMKTSLKPAPGDPNGFSFSSWKALDADFLIRTGYKVIGDTVSLDAYLYQVPLAKTVLSKTYEGSVKNLRTIAHLFANDIVKTLTGKQGFFMTKFVAVMRENLKSPKEVWVMDWDGANATKISNHKSIAISPAWSPKGDKVAYTAFNYHENIKSRNADLFIYDLKQSRRWLVSYKKGINSGANFLADGLNMLMTLSQAGTPDIYKVSTDGNTMKRISNGPNKAMNVEPAVSPDGKKIAFSSDRSGQPMLYVMNIDGSNAKRLTFAGRYNSSPSWSPDGKTIAFSGYDKTHFDIFTIQSDGTGLKRITEAKTTTGKDADNRDPSWSPDGRSIVFTSNRTGSTQIYIIDSEGNYERRITSDKFDWEQPKWSGYLD